MPRSTAGLYKAVLILAVPVVFIVLSVPLFMSDAYLRHEYSQPDFPPALLGLGYSERLPFAARNFVYVRTSGPISLLEQQTHNGALLYNSRELKHMQDEQAVWLATWAAGWIAAAVIALAGAWLAWRAQALEALAEKLIRIPYEGQG